MNSWGAPFFAESKKVTKMSSQSHPKCLPKCLQKPSKIDQKTKPKNNTKNHRIWLPKWSQNGAKSVWIWIPVPPKNAFQIQLRFFIVFGAILGAKFENFSCYFLASFFDRFLKASGSILGGILVDFGRSFWLLFLIMRKKAHPTNSL